MFQVIGELVFKVLAPYASSSRPVSKWITGLYHKFCDDTVKNDPVKESTACVADKIFHRLRSLRWEQPNVDVSHRCMNRGRVCHGRRTRLAVNWRGGRDRLLLSSRPFVKDVTVFRFAVPAQTKKSLSQMDANIFCFGLTQVQSE